MTESILQHSIITGHNSWFIKELKEELDLNRSQLHKAIEFLKDKLLLTWDAETIRQIGMDNLSINLTDEQLVLFLEYLTRNLDTSSQTGDIETALEDFCTGMSIVETRAVIVQVTSTRVVELYDSFKVNIPLESQLHSEKLMEKIGDEIIATQEPFISASSDHELKECVFMELAETSSLSDADSVLEINVIPEEE